MNLRSRNKIQVQAGMSSMTDLVFLLLIFFIIMSTLAQPQYNIDLPKGDVPEPLEDGRVDVVVNKDNVIQVDYKNSMVTAKSEEDAHKMILEGVKTLKDAGMAEPKIRYNGDRASDFEIYSNIMVLAKHNEIKVVVATK